MVLTKTQVLNYLTKLQNKSAKWSAKYTAIGVAKILVRKDMITIDDILLEFPELNE